MKKYYVTVLLIIVPVLIFAQPDNIKQIIDKYNGKEGFTLVNLNSPSELFGDDANSSMKDEIKDVRDMVIMSYDPDDNAVTKSGKDFAEDLKNFDKKLGMKPMVSVTNEDEFVRIYRQQTKDKQLLIIVNIENDGGASLIWINGNLDFNALNDLAKPQKRKKK